MSRKLSALMIAAALGLVPLTAGAQEDSPAPKGKPPLALPDGKAKPMVEGICATCHAIQLIPSSSGYTREHWQELVATMIDLSGNKEQQNEIIDYLATNFPPNKRRAPTPAAGNFQVTFKEWVMPQLGQRTRDPMQAADGTIWYAGQYGNLIGRLDPKTGKAREYPLPANANPHTVQVDPKGRPWYSGNKNGTIGWIDPASGKATVYKMPDPEAKDTHTITFDKKGWAYFTFQHANMIGRLNPDTGDIKLVKVAAQRSQPYDIKFAPDGVLWVSCNARPCLLKVNPDTLDITEVALPLAGTTVRRFDIAPDGIIWYVNSGKGRIGRVNPKSGEITEWDSPSGPRSHPYGIAVLDGAVWYNESGMRPDMLVRFDIATETFQSWPIKSGNVYAGILRNARVTKQGTLLIHQTATNRVIEVIPQRTRAAAAQ
jgi:virginiamycin B lyase